VSAQRIGSVNDFLSLLKSVKETGKGQWLALCPSHHDTKPSLSIKETDGKILLKCFGGCGLADILRSLGLEFGDLFLVDGNKPPAQARKIVATYDYQNADGNLISQVVRYEPKAFAQRRPDGKGGWLWNLSGVKPVLYHLPEIIKTNSTDTIYVVEGEGCADALWSVGLIATTSPGGAGNWRPEYSKYFNDRRLVIIPDNDPEGLRYARAVATSSRGLAREMRAIILPNLPPKGDIVDWFNGGGWVGDLESLGQDVSALFQSSQPDYHSEGEKISWYLGNQVCFHASDLHWERTGTHARLEIYGGDEPLSWSVCNTDRHEDRVRLANAAYCQMDKGSTDSYSKEQLRSDLDRFCLGLWDYHLSCFMPEMVAGSEEDQPLKFLLKPFVLEGGGTIVFAPPGRGKSYAALIFAVSVDAGVSKFWPTNKAPVLFINLERSAQSLRRRLATVNRALDLDLKRPLLTLNARGKSLYDVLPVCSKAIAKHGVELIVLDSISRAGYGDLTENKPVTNIIDSLSGLSKSWLSLAHTPRQNEGHLYGSIHFEAGADVIIQLLSQQKDDGTLGVGFQSTKANDIPPIPMSIYAMEFTETGLSDFRKAKSFEFPEIEEKRKRDTDDLIEEFILDRETGDATASEIAEALGLNRSHLSTMLHGSDRYIQRRKVGRSVYYGVKTKL